MPNSAKLTHPTTPKIGALWLQILTDLNAGLAREMASAKKGKLRDVPMTTHLSKVLAFQAHLRASKNSLSSSSHSTLASSTGIHSNSSELKKTTT